MYLFKTKGIDFILKIQLFYNLLFIGVLMNIPTRNAYILYAIINVIIAVCLFRYIKPFVKGVSKYALFIYVILFLYTCYIFINFNGGYSIRTLLRFLYHPWYFMCYIAPFIIFGLSKIEDLQIVLRFVYKQSLLYFILLMVCLIYCSFSGNDNFKKYFEFLQIYIGGGLVLLPFYINNFNRKEKLYIYFILLLTILISAILARRSILLVSLLSFIFGYFVGIVNKRATGAKVSAIFSIILSMAVVFIVDIETISSYFPLLSERMMDDTRSEAELEVLYYLERQGKVMTGAGFNSVFYSYFVDEVRDNVETGYLSQMLRGGIVYIILFALFTLPAIFNTILKKQKRNLIPFAAYSILFIIAYNIASNGFSFSIRYILFLYGIACMYKNCKQSL